MRVGEHFGLGGLFCGYPLIEVIIKAIGYRFPVVPIFLVSVSVVNCQGQIIDGRVLGASQASGCLLYVLSKQNSKPKNRAACRPKFYLRLTIMFSN